MLTTIIGCVDLDAELAFFRRCTDFRVHLVSPADDPRRAVLRTVDGDVIELVRGDIDRPVTLVMEAPDSDERTLTSPGGTTVTMRSPDNEASGMLGAEMDVPANVPTLSVVEPTVGSFGVGRAGMEYRDLLPDRWGGRFIASHIRIVDGGDVDDWVHFHRIRFQMIYVVAGWVDVVYEGQGEPFRMEAGDCVLQPPEIRHRVLRSSPGLEVVEIGCPAEHDTVADHDMELPSTDCDPARRFSGQAFVRHVARSAASTPWVTTDMAQFDTGIAEATGGLAGVVVVRSDGAADADGTAVTHHGEFVLIVALSGSAVLHIDGKPLDFDPRTSIALPAGTQWAWSVRSDDHSALVVTMPADAVELV